MSREEFAKIMAQGKEMSSPEPARERAMDAPAQTATKETASFSGELGALFREGLKDLQNVVLHAFPDSVRGVEEPGTPLNPTQQMVTDAVVGGPEPARGKEFSLQGILNAPPQATPTAQAQGRDMEREM